jgi:hypothetical protein
VSTTKRISLAIALLVALATVVTPAFAATPAKSFESLSVGVQRAAGVLLVSAQVPSTAKLPVTIAVPIPSRSKPYWVGEILGGDPANDPKESFTIRKGAKYDLVILTLKQARTGQVEMNLPAAAQATGPTKLSYSLPITTDTALASLDFELPAGTAVGSATGFAKSQGPNGDIVLTKQLVNPKRGRVLSASVSYSAVAAAAVGVPTASSAAPSANSLDGMAVPLWIVVALFAGLLAKTAYDDWKSRQAEAPEAHIEGDEDTAFDVDDAPPTRRRAGSTSAKKPATSASKPNPAAGASAQKSTGTTPKTSRRSPGSPSRRGTSTKAAPSEGA